MQSLKVHHLSIIIIDQKNVIIAVNGVPFLKIHQQNIKFTT